MAQVAPPVQANSYDLTVGVMLDIEDLIHTLSPSDVPLLGAQGADGRSAISRGTCFETLVSWLDEELLLPKSNAASAATTGELTITVTTGDGLRFSTGDVIVNGTSGEKMLVTGKSTDALTVTRGFAGTTASTSTVATTDNLLVIGQALQEGSNPENPRVKDRAKRDNYTQIFGPTAIRVSGTENVVRKYGLNTTEFDHQVGNRTKEAFIQIEQATLYGTAYESTTLDVRTMGGFTNYISTNHYSTATAFTEAILLGRLQAAYDYGGRVDRITTNSTLKRAISAFAATPLSVNVNQSDRVRGTVVDVYDSDFGRVSVLLNRWCDTGDVFGWDRDQAELCTLRPMQFEMLSKTGDSVYGQIVGEYTLKFRRERHAFRCSAVT